MEIRDLLIYLSIKYDGVWNRIYQAIKEKENIDSKECEKVLKTLTTKAITIFDKEYPKNLKHIYKCPFVLYYKGDISLLNKKIVSFVGSRNPSDYSLLATKKIVSELDSDIVVCSGLAKGIDSCALSEAINNNMATIAVLPTGIDQCYPIENISLYYEIENKGLLISEYPLKCKVDKSNFAFRNRIISSLCSSLVISEVHKNSGTSVTVKYALEMNKDIYCIPHEIFEDCLCNNLIKDGAYLITSGDDINR